MFFYGSRLTASLGGESTWISLWAPLARRWQPTATLIICVADLLALYRETVDSFWFDGAWALAGRAMSARAAENQRRLSLYKGQMGVAVLLAGLSVSEHAAMPFFEPEGWSDVRRTGSSIAQSSISSL